MPQRRSVEVLPSEERSARMPLCASTLRLLGALALAACRTGEAESALVVGDPAAGFALVRELGCASCHPGTDVPAEPAPRLERVGARLTPAAIEAALSAGARMPDCLAPLGKRERAAARAELTHFLVSLGGPLSAGNVAGDALRIERGRQLYHSIGCVACHAPFEKAETLARALWDFPEAFEPAAPAPAQPAAA